MDQIKKIIAILGSPNVEDLSFITNDQAKEFVIKLPNKSQQNLKTLFPKSNPNALDLLSKMLVFNPNKRYTVKQCLAHPYFDGLHNPLEEPVGETPFDWKFDELELTKENLQKMIYEESLNFHAD